MEKKNETCITEPDQQRHISSSLFNMLAIYQKYVQLADTSQGHITQFSILQENISGINRLNENGYYESTGCRA
ncbi:hypothetical protein [Maribellus luteus]|uniref:hypothetical protein n=1 Tax=Maribellus luteus TaxID=2305463 RepID=UPI00188051B8|nr:hypothetical protein [Maribellus luteus]